MKRLAKMLMCVAVTGLVLTFSASQSLARDRDDGRSARSSFHRDGGGDRDRGFEHRGWYAPRYVYSSGYSYVPRATYYYAAPVIVQPNCYYAPVVVYPRRYSGLSIRIGW